MNLSARERRLLVSLAVIVALAAAFLVFRPGAADEPLDLGLFPSVAPSATAPASPEASPTFVVPSGLRDPFQPQP